MGASLHLSLDEYDRMVACGAFDGLGRKVELIRGELVEMNPAGPVHDDYIGYLIDWSFRSTNRNQIRILAQTGVNVAQSSSRVEPDVFWVKARRYLDAHPTGKDTLLAIEVADSSLQSDRTTKAKLYAEAGIQEYWVVDVSGQCIYVMREPNSDGVYASLRTVYPKTNNRQNEPLSPLAQPDAILDLADLFDLYGSPGTMG